MEEYLPQMLHSGSRKKQENLTIPAKNVLPRPAPPLYKVLATPLPDRYVQIWLKTRKSILNKVTKFQIATPNGLGARIEKPPGGRICPAQGIIGLNFPSLFQGKNCNFSHRIIPAHKMELCKFYAQASCYKRDGCLYLHKAFPCKLFHTGARCYPDAKCKFSHEPLTDITRPILLKVSVPVSWNRGRRGRMG